MTLPFSAMPQSLSESHFIPDVVQGLTKAKDNSEL